MLEAAPVSLDARRPRRRRRCWSGKLKGVASPGVRRSTSIRSVRSCARATFSPSDAEGRVRLSPRACAARCPRRRACAWMRVQCTKPAAPKRRRSPPRWRRGIAYLRVLTDDDGLDVGRGGAALSFAVSVGPDVLVEAAKLRALRLCWARVLEASGAAPEHRAAHIHAFTSRRMMTRYDAWTNILRVTTAAFAAGVGGADDITTYPFTDALGLPTPFARRVARNTQHVLLEECRLGHVADPAGGAWFVEKLTRDLAAKAWEIMQNIEAGRRHRQRAAERISANHCRRSARAASASDRHAPRNHHRRHRLPAAWRGDAGSGANGPPASRRQSARPARCRRSRRECLQPIRWAEPFEALRDAAEAQASALLSSSPTLGAARRVRPARAIRAQPVRGGRRRRASARKKNTPRAK